MRVRDLLPALGLMLLVTAVVAGGELVPFGPGLFLVRLGPAALARALADPRMADATLVGVPAPGFVLIKGRAAPIRASAGLAVSWSGGGLCSP